MRTWFLLAAVLATLLAGCAQRCPPPPAPAAPAKAFAMRTYYVAFLRRGPAWTAEPTDESRAIGAAHMANIEAMAQQGVLALAGPFEHGDDAPADAIAGIFVLDVKTREEAVALAGRDPAVQAGRFTVEVLPWYGPVGLTFDGDQH